MNQSQKFELICGVLAETDWNVHFTVTFDDVCRRYGADPRRMDNMFYDRFGMSGPADQLLDIFGLRAKDIAEKAKEAIKAKK